MNLESLITHYGYMALLVGTIFEGETILILGGIAAHLGYLSLPWVILVAFLGGFCGDQLFFYLGRHHNRSFFTFLSKSPSWQRRAQRVQNLITRYRLVLILGFRFLYGLRMITPFVLGMSRVPIRYFLFLNMISVLVWAGLIGSTGYLFGNALGMILGDLKRYEWEVILLGTTLGLLIWAVHHYRSRKMHFGKENGKIGDATNPTSVVKISRSEQGQPGRDAEYGGNPKKDSLTRGNSTKEEK
jgi:membrane protein DedA with SNARE-associated domain